MLKARRPIVLALTALGIAATWATLAHAQSPLGIGTAEPAFNMTGPFGGFFAWVNREQQGFYHTLTAALKGMRENPWQLWSLIGLSFSYGVFHAAGPGHGKAVISSYMIANETELKRGVVLSFLSSFLQGIVAILLVGAAYLVLRGSSISMTQATQFLETTSYALIAAFGGWLLYRKLKAMMVREPALVPALATDHHHHDHHHDGHHHHEAGEVCSTCGHAHAPDPSMLKGETFDWREAWSAIVAVGLRPCSGALIVLSFALLNGLYIGGVLSVLAMSVGTAITVSALATLAVTAKDFAVRYASSATTATRIGNAIEIFGALLVLVLGLVLLGAALQA
ncbi:MULTISPECIES: nickel/cobalt transporter [unclassified Rhizobium]|uniref:nickel/cobalt transporter n=1 Tax=unclassified Rhizobium TaxID=2613769 RepID=UPI0006F1EE14|nr:MULTISPECIES: nickel/cobalt transporter [unclassified Rhizobium]KQV35029.1 delayed-early response protein/equilibrative nucleoside transporter [Rhizobium sp. Root1212]KRD24834.1 delayed-early response protein/equilibrative nucleoside transporter [Rhizobium sp. Root268]